MMSQDSVIDELSPGEWVYQILNFICVWFEV